MRELPMRERKPKKRIEEDPAVRERITHDLPAPAGTRPFQQGYRECIAMYALHAPNRRGVGRILEEHCITLEDACVRSGMSRDDLARYEGFRQAMKDLRTQKRIR